MIWLPALIATLVLMAASVTIATVIGIPAAWACTVLLESKKTGRWIATVSLAVFAAMILVPLVLHAAAWEATAGKFGITMLTQTGTQVSPAAGYGFFSGLPATAWIHGVHGAAIMALATGLGVMRMPRSITDQSRLDAGPIARWWKIRLRIARPWWILGMMAVAGLAATEMTVADLYGYRTVVDQFYLNFAFSPSVPAVIWTCGLPLLVAAMLILYWTAMTTGVFRNGALTNDSNWQRPSSDHGKISLLVAIAIVIVAVVLTAVVPLTGLLGNLGRTVAQQDDQLSVSWSAQVAIERAMSAPTVFASEYRWTAIIACVTSVTSVVLAWPIASIGRRYKRFRQAIDLITIAMVCIPGPIVGLAVVSLFQLNLPGFAFLYQQTIVPTVISLLARGFPISYWIIRGGYQSIASTTLDQARLDTTPIHQFWSIERPLILRSLIAAALVSAVVTSGDLPASLPVIPAGMTTVPVRLFGLLHSGARYQEAALVIWYVLVVLLVFAALRLVYNSRRNAA